MRVVELGDLEVEILRVLATQGESRPREIQRHLQKDRPVAYTTVTNTLYRLVEKRLVRVRHAGLRRAYFSVSENSGARNRVARALVSRLVRAFGADAVARLIEGQTDGATTNRRTRSHRGP